MRLEGNEFEGYEEGGGKLGVLCMGIGLDATAWSEGVEGSGGDIGGGEVTSCDWVILGVAEATEDVCVEEDPDLDREIDRPDGAAERPTLRTR